MRNTAEHESFLAVIVLVFPVEWLTCSTRNARKQLSVSSRVQLPLHSLLTGLSAVLPLSDDGWITAYAFMFRMLHLRQSREVNVFMSCCSQRLLNADPTTAQLIPTLSAQKRTTALRERSPSRWLGAQGSSHNQNSCSTATVRAQTVCVSSLLPRNGNLTYLAASSQSFVDFSQEHFLPDSEEVTDGSGDG